MIKTIELKIMQALEKVLYLNANPPSEHEDLNALGLNSIKTIALVVELEERFDITFEDDELLFENFATIRTIADRISGKLVSLHNESATAVRQRT